MTLFYFGFAPRERGTTKLAVKTSAGELEPVEPSRFTVYVHRVYHPVFSMISTILGLIVAVMSFPAGHYVHTSASGLLAKPAGADTLPFRTPGLAVVLKKGRRFGTDIATRLENAGFSAMEYSGRSVWLKENASRDDFLIVQDERDVDPIGPAPARFCNTDSFRAFLVLRSYTTRICEFFHYLGTGGLPYPSGVQKRNSELKAPYVNARDSTGEDITMGDTAPEFTKPAVVAMSTPNDSRFTAFLKASFSSDGLSTTSSSVAISVSRNTRGFMRPWDGEKLMSHGIVMKFHPRLALPDTNLIGDVLGRRFLAGLGEDLEEQTDNLDLLKSGLSSLRLTRLGDELTHLYRCLDLAIECNAGCIPIFTQSIYEGCVITGGPGATLIHNGAKFPFLSVTSLKQDMLNVSTHATALRRIAGYAPTEEVKGEFLKVSSMVELRALCLTLAISQSDRDDIIRTASDLEFPHTELVINPANLKRCFTLITTPLSLKPSDPIGRMSLFESDPVIVALSMFGEKTAPSWDVPNGTTCSLKKGSPPTPPVDNLRKKGSAGTISDAAWVMVIRQTDLFSAADEFRKMASTLVYRSTSSTLARKVGHRVMGRDRMGEFWAEMREALRTVNPNADYEEGKSSGKRVASDSPSTVMEGEMSSKRRRMEF